MAHSNSSSKSSSKGSRTASKSGPTSFGFRRVKGRLIHDPYEAPILKRMFELFFELQRKKAVALELTYEKAKTRNGSDFTGQTIGRLLQNDLVLGIAGELEPLITQELFENVQNILAAQKGQAKRKTAHLFAGLTYCGCGGKMYVRSGSHKYTCRACKFKIHKQDLEAIFVQKLKAHYSHIKEAEDLLILLERWSVLGAQARRAILESTTKHITIERNLVTLSLVTLYKT